MKREARSTPLGRYRTCSPLQHNAIGEACSVRHDESGEIDHGQFGEEDAGKFILLSDRTGVPKSERTRREEKRREEKIHSEKK